MLEFMPRLKNLVNTSLRHANFVPYKRDKVLKVNKKVLPILYHTQCICPTGALLSMQIKVLAYITLVVDNSNLHAHFNAIL